MGTPQIPDSKPEFVAKPEIEDFPRVGPATWFLLAAFLIPPTLITFIGNLIGGFPHQTLWIILLGCPIPIVMLLLPRKYVLDSQYFCILGVFYRVRIPREEIVSIQPVSLIEALLHPGSFFCSDPSHGLKLVRRNRRAVIISPKNPQPFLDLIH